MQKRYIYLALATASMCVAGLMYNFTVFHDVIMNSIAIDQSSISLVFSLSQIMFCTGGIIFGFIYNKFSYRFLMVIGGALMVSGFFLTGRATQAWQLFLFYSIMMNLGAGAVYKVVLSAVLPWFYEKPGLASGIMMMGAGLTAFVFNVPTTKVIEAMGWRAAMTILALIVFVIVFVSAFVVEKGEQVKKTGGVVESDPNDTETKAMVIDPRWYLFFIWTVLLLAGCTTVTGNAVNLSKSLGMTASGAAALSMVISLFNASSRIFYGRAYDKMGRKAVMTIAVTCFAIASVLLQISLRSGSVVMLVITFMTTGFAFGGVPTIASTYILQTFGRTNYAANFGVQSAYSIFSPILGTTVFSMFFRATNNYASSYTYILVYGVLAVVLHLVINRLLAKQEA